MDDDEQLYLLEEALSQYTLPPNPLSLATHYDLPPNLFQLYAEESDQLIPSLASRRPSQTVSNSGSASDLSAPPVHTPKPYVGRKTIETPAGHVVGYEEILSKNKEWTVDPPSDKIGSKTARELMQEIRWANLGWVYQVRLFFECLWGHH